MKLPAKFTVEVEEDSKIANDDKRAKESCGSVVGAMVWLSRIIPAATYVLRGHADASWNLESSLKRSKQPSTMARLKQEEKNILEEIASDFWF